MCMRVCVCDTNLLKLSTMMMALKYTTIITIRTMTTGNNPFDYDDDTTDRLNCHVVIVMMMMKIINVCRSTYKNNIKNFLC